MPNDNKVRWGTWEDLVLGSAVCRHGTNSWDKISQELHSRNLSSFPFTPQICKAKYEALQSRFGAHESNNCSNRVFWLEELRKLRVSQLKKELERYDMSILSLESKLNRLKAEREESLGSKKNGGYNAKSRISERFRDPVVEDPDTGPENPNEKKLQANKSIEGSLRTSPVGSFNGSSETITKEQGQNDNNKMVVDMVKKQEEEAGSIDNSVGEVREYNPLENSDVMSSVELRDCKNAETMTKKATGLGDAEVSPSSSIKISKKKDVKITGNWSLHIECLRAITSHKFGYLFHHRSESQDNLYYQSIIMRHMDLGMVKSRLEEGSYSGSMEFFRDLLLVFNNAIVYHPKGSQEFMAAVMLRKLVINEMTHILQKESLETQQGSSTRKKDSRKSRPKHKSEEALYKTPSTNAESEQIKVPKPKTPDPSKTLKAVNTKVDLENAKVNGEVALCSSMADNPKLKILQKSYAMNQQSLNSQSKKRTRDSDIGLTISSSIPQKPKTKANRKLNAKGYEALNNSMLENSLNQVVLEDQENTKVKVKAKSKDTQRNKAQESKSMPHKAKLNEASKKNNRRSEQRGGHSPANQKQAAVERKDKQLNNGSSEFMIAELQATGKRVGRPPKHARHQNQEQNHTESELIGKSEPTTKSRKRIRK